MKSFVKLKIIRVFVLSTLLAALMAACGSVNLSTSPTPAPTSSPTLIPTSTNIPSPTPTKTLVPTATKELTPEQQREHDFGSLVPKAETCVRHTELYMNDPGFISPDTAFAELSVHSTGVTQKIKMPLGKDNQEQNVTMLQVVCRKANGNIAKPMWLVLGSGSFGKDHNGKNTYWITVNNGTGIGIEVVTTDQVVNQIEKGLEIRVDIPVKKGSGNLVDRFWDIGTSNQLANEAIRRFDQNQDQLKQIVDGMGASQDDFQLFPIRITIGPFNYP
jgi:hypothetical protein